MITQYIVVGLFIIYAVLAFVFSYNAVDGVVGALVSCIFIGALLTGLTLYFWKVALVIIILVGLGKIMECESSEGRIAVGIITVIVAVMIVVAGKSFVKGMKEEGNKLTQQYMLKEQDVYVYENLENGKGYIS